MMAGYAASGRGHVIASHLDECFHRWLYLTLQRLRGRPIRPYLAQLQAWEALEPQVYQNLARELRIHILDYAARHVPLYRTKSWQSALRHGDPTDLSIWPILEKQVAVQHADLLRAAPAYSHTARRFSSTSSGHKSLCVEVDPITAGWSWAHEYRALQWHGIELGAPTLVCMHNMLRLSRETRFQDWVRNRHGFFADHLSAQRIDHLADQLVQGRFQLCWGLASVMFQIARRVRAKYADAPSTLASVVKLGGEPVYPFQRQQIESLLGAHVTQNYGCTEVGPIASECSHGRLHIFATHVHVEIFRGNEPAAPGEFGDLVVTSLGNRAMPLVRCRIGDQARLSEERCPCGMPLPVMEQLTSRTEDMLITAQGQAVHASTLGQNLHRLFDRIPPADARQIQFQQLSRTHWRVLVETNQPLDATIRNHVIAFVRDRFGSLCTVDVQAVAFIPRETSGKFRYYRMIDSMDWAGATALESTAG